MLGKCQQISYLLSANRRETFQKLIDRVAAFEILE